MKAEHQPYEIGTCIYIGRNNTLYGCRDWNRKKWEHPFSDDHDCTLVDMEKDNLHPVFKQILSEHLGE